MLIPIKEPVSQDQILVREISHRVNNEFASAIGMVTLEAAHSGNVDAKVALSGVIELLHSYAQVHRALEMPVTIVNVDAGRYLRELCQAISRSRLQYRGIELTLSECELELRSDRCWRLGMILSELITNAERHAFRGNVGTIRIEISSTDALVECRVLDNGFGSESKAPGQGLTIIGALTAGLGGRLSQRFSADGSETLIVFPN